MNFHEKPRNPDIKLRSPLRAAGGPCGPPASLGSLAVLALQRLHLLLELRFQRLQVEGPALLHRRILEEGLGVPADFVFHEHEAPELVGELVVERERAAASARQARALERIESEIDDDRPIDLNRAAQPTARLIDEAVLVVVEA